MVGTGGAPAIGGPDDFAPPPAIWGADLSLVTVFLSRAPLWISERRAPYQIDQSSVRPCFEYIDLPGPSLLHLMAYSGELLEGEGEEVLPYLRAAEAAVVEEGAFYG